MIILLSLRLGLTVPSMSVSGNYYLYAMNPGGTLKWRYLTGTGFTPRLLSVPTAQSMWDHRIITFTPSTLGTLKWRYLTGAGVLLHPPLVATVQSTWGSLDKYLYALNPDEL
jgi:hypothetical protein